MPLPRPRALLLDMDGTITQPLLDFPLIRREMGIGEQPILETMALLPPERRAECEAILLRHEDHAAEHSRLNPGCAELLDWLRDHAIPTALVTRNSRRSVERVLARHGLRFDVLLTRDDAPPKPSPLPLWLALRRLAALRSSAARPGEAWMVGDGHHDIEAGLAAGMPTIWISHGKPRAFAAAPWRALPDLPALLDLLRSTA